MATSLAQLNVSIFNNGAIAFADTYEVNNSSAPISVQTQFAFATGDNTFTKPTGAVALIIANQTGVLKLYSSASPSLGTSFLVVGPIPVSGSTIIINAAAGVLADLVWI